MNQRILMATLVGFLGLLCQSAIAADAPIESSESPAGTTPGWSSLVQKQLANREYFVSQSVN